MPKSTNTSYEKICGDLGHKVSILFILDCGLDDHHSSFLLILKVDELILRNQGGLSLDWLEDLKTFLTVQEHHWVECWNSWNREVLETHAMSDDHVHCWERLELLCVFVSEIKMLLV